MKHKKEEICALLKDMTFSTSYRVLEQGKDDDELTKIAEKHHIQLPARDLAIFKGTFAFIDKENKNGCTLPKEEVEKAIKTIAGKAVDFDHFRKRVVGFWLEGQIEDNTIISYGIFHKGNFQEDFEEVKKQLNEGKLGISFEAYGERVMTDTASYDLTNIEFAGGALLLKEEPAFPGAGVLEMARVMTPKNARILEVASTTNKTSIAPADTKGIFKLSLDFSKKEKEYREYARFFTWDMETISRLLFEVKCPTGGEEAFLDILAIDFEHSVVKARCNEHDSTFLISLTPRVQEVREQSERKIVKIEKIDTEKSNNTSEEKTKMEDIKKLQEEVAKLKVAMEAKDKEIASLTTELEKSKKETEEAKSQVEKSTKDQEAAVEKAKADATKVAERRAELGEEYAKDMSDEKILDDKEFTIAKQNKEIAELKAKKDPENKGKEDPKEKGSLEVGAKDKDKDKEVARAGRIKSFAFPERK